MTKRKNLLIIPIVVFMTILFSLLTPVSAYAEGAHIIRQDYRPLRTIKLLMDYSHRSELLLCAGISEDINATKPDKTIPFEHFRNAGNTLGATPAPEVPMLGRWVDGIHSEPMEFGYDLTDLTATVDRTKPLKYFFIVKTKDGTIGKGHIYKASTQDRCSCSKSRIAKSCLSF